MVVGIRHYGMHGKDNLADSVVILYQPIRVFCFSYQENWSAIREVNGDLETVLQ